MQQSDQLDAKAARNGGPSFSLKNRIFRVLWRLSWFMLASWTPAPFHRWRVFILNLFGSSIHYSAHVYGSTDIWYPPNLEMDENSTLGPQVKCYCMAKIQIERNAIVSQGAYLCTGTHEIDDPWFPLVAKPIVIGNGAWVAAEAFIGPGVTIGSNAVVGARAVMFKNASPEGIYIGNPAKLLKTRIISSILP